MLGCLNSPEGKVTPTEMQKALIIIIILGFTNQAQGFDPWDKEKFRWVTWKKKKEMKLKLWLDQPQIPPNVRSHDQTNKDHMILILKLTLLTLSGTLSRKLCEITNKVSFKMSCSYAIPWDHI